MIPKRWTKIKQNFINENAEKILNRLQIVMNKYGKLARY